MIYSGFKYSAKIMAVVAIAFVSTVGYAKAQSSIPQVIAGGCADELKKYCKDVEPGERRLFACLYAHSDKLSDNCALSMYDGYDQFISVMSALQHIAKRTSCRSDIAQYCKGVPPIGGRLYECVRKNKATLTDGCRAALPRAEELLKRTGILK